MLADLLKLIHDTPNLDWLLLTKRPENFDGLVGAFARQFVRLSQHGDYTDAGRGFAEWLASWLTGKAPHNVWVGTSVEDQKRADERIPALLKIPARVRFLSVEPMLENIDFSEALWKSGCEPHCGEKCSKDADCPMGVRGEIHWCIFGGESGPNARACNVEWIRDGIPCMTFRPTPQAGRHFADNSETLCEP